MYANKKNLIFALLLILGLLFTTARGGVSAAAGDLEGTLQAGADRLTSLQNNDGGWDWPLDDGNPANASPVNTISPIGKGLAMAYLHTRDADHLYALESAGDLLLSKMYNFSPSDGYFAVQLDEIFGVTDFSTHVLSNFYGPLSDGTYNRNNAGARYSTGGYVELIRTARAGLGNLAAWDIGMGLVSAKLIGADTDPWITGLEAELNEFKVDADYTVLGLAGAVYGLAVAGVDFDPTNGDLVDASSTNDLAQTLAGYQLANGGFPITPGDDSSSTQETAYATLALNAFDRATFLTTIQSAADYLMNIQLLTGGWGESSGDTNGENNEVTGEALWAISEVHTLWVCETGDCGHPGNSFNSIQAAIDAAADRDTILVAAGTYPEDLEVGKSLTILGPNSEISPNTGTRTAEAILAPINEVGKADTAILATASNITVAIKGLTLDLSNTTDNNDRFVEQINKTGNTWHFEHNIFTGAPETINGNWYITGSTDPTDITIDDNYFHHNKVSNGISLWGNGHTINIANNVWRDNQGWAINVNNVTGTITDNQVLDTEENGDEWYFEQAGFLFENRMGLTVSGNLFDGIPNPSIRLYPKINGRMTFEGNTFQNTEDAIGVVRISDGADLSQVEFHGNKFLNNPINLQNFDSDPLDASPNWWGSKYGPSGMQINGVVDYTPWCADENCTTFLPDTNGEVRFPAGVYNFPGGFVVNEPGLTIILEDGAVIQNNSPCFIVNASNTTIMAATPGGAKCVPTGGSNGIDVAAGLSGVRVINLEIDGTNQNTGDGIHFAGGIADFQIVNNYIHDLDGDGVEFTAQPAGVVQIQGNLFQNNAGRGIEASAFTVSAEYNSWGHKGGASAGDGASANVDADPWTHVDLWLEPSGTPWTNQIAAGGTITYAVKANLKNVMGAEFILTYPTGLTVESTAVGTVFGNKSVDATATGSITFRGYELDGTPVDGDGVTLFTVVFEAATAGTYDLTFDATSDNFAMAPPSGSSNFIYAAGLKGASFSAIGLPTITSTDIQGYYLTGEARDFHVSVSNPDTGGTFVNSIYYVFTIANAKLVDLNSLTCKFDGSTDTDIKAAMTEQGDNVVGRVGYGGAGFPMAPSFSTTTACTANFATAGSYAFTVDMVDGASTPADFKLATLSQTAAVYDKPAFSVAGLTAPLLGGTEREFQVTLNNPDTGIETYVKARFTLLNAQLADIASIQYYEVVDSSWHNLPMSQVDDDLVGYFGPSAGFLMIASYNATSQFRVTFANGVTRSYNYSVELFDLTPDPDRPLTRLEGSFAVHANIAAVTGTVSMQGRVFRGGVPMALTGTFGFGPFTATSIDQISNNIIFTNVAAGQYAITTNQPRYLNITAGLKTFTVSSTKTSITALELKGGDATLDNEVGLEDASAVGTSYGQTGNLNADVNFSGRVDIFDLALVGGNYGLTSSTAYASWTP